MNILLTIQQNVNGKSTERHQKVRFWYYPDVNFSQLGRGGFMPSPIFQYQTFSFGGLRSLLFLILTSRSEVLGVLLE